MGQGNDARNAVNTASVNIDNIDNGNGSIDSSTRRLVFHELDRNNDLTPKDICQKLGLSYKLYGHSIRTYKCQWKRQYVNRVGEKSLSLNKWHGYAFVPSFVNRDSALGLGDGVTSWQPTKAKNRMFIFDARCEKLGRIEWFEPRKDSFEQNSGRVNITLLQPPSPGKLKQLLANAFCKTGLFSDVKCFDSWTNTVRLKGAHLVKDLEVSLPYSKTEFLKDGLGVVVKTGDRSHKTGLEIEFSYPDWAERNEDLLKHNKMLMTQNNELLSLNADLMRQNLELNKRLLDLFTNKPQPTENTQVVVPPSSVALNRIYE